MHIEFKLPTGAGGHAAGHYSAMLRRKVSKWADEHNITVINYVSGYRICFEFGRESDYTLFALSWTTTNRWDSYYLITD